MSENDKPKIGLIFIGHGMVETLSIMMDLHMADLPHGCEIVYFQEIPEQDPLPYVINADSIRATPLAFSALISRCIEHRSENEFCFRKNTHIPIFPDTYRRMTTPKIRKNVNFHRRMLQR